MKEQSKILVDSSVWIRYFKEGDELLYKLIKNDIICTNELILTELIPVLQHRKEKTVVESLRSLEVVPFDIGWSIIRKYQLLNLQNGINKVGIPDLIILQQVIENKLTFYSLDKHFWLMSKFLSIELIENTLSPKN